MADAERLFAALRTNTLDAPGVTRASYGPADRQRGRLVDLLRIQPPDVIGLEDRGVHGAGV